MDLVISCISLIAMMLGINGGYGEFWEALSYGWLNMESEYRMSQPGFDPYNLRGRDSYYSYVMSKI